MGGVELHNWQVSKYHISIRSKKWWWPISEWSLNSTLKQLYLLQKNVMGETIDLLTFSCILAQSLLQNFGKTTDPWKENSTDCYCWRSGKIWKLLTGQLTQCMGSRDIVIMTNTKYTFLFSVNESGNIALKYKSKCYNKVTQLSYTIV